MNASAPSIRWVGLLVSGHAVASGVYFARLRGAGERPATRRLVLLR